MGLRIVRGRVLKVGDNVDTDAIIPGKYLTLTDPRELGKHALEGLDPSMPSLLKDRQIIVAGRNFGCGSSREHAVLALLGAGVKAVLAESFARIFYRNAINRGLLAIEVPGVRNAVADGEEVIVNVEETTLITASGKTLGFKPIPKELLEIIEAGGLVESLKKGLTK
ncbi:MAG: 3-isopropylmalate dehydratase small subunit [Desulfurococcaceae archaeon]|jgi:3-isopropylmalate/(R)-2-methylmalate dehydratase small subunit|nr:3-isopropylmalate dehydratase small subunit [Desulfurococcaceae archaeon]